MAQRFRGIRADRAREIIDNRLASALADLTPEGIGAASEGHDHPLATPGGAKGYISGPDLADLRDIVAGGGAGGSAEGVYHVATTAAEIQPALDAAASLGGGTVVLMPGTHETQGVTIGSNTTLRGMPGAVIKLQGGATTHAVIVPATSSRVSIENLVVDGNRANQAVPSDDRAGPRPFHISGVDVSVSRCKALNSIHDGLTIGDGGKWVWVDKCIADNTRRYGMGTDGDQNPAVTPEKVFFTDNLCRNTGNGWNQGGGAGFGVFAVGYDIHFIGNTTQDTNGDGIAAYGSRCRGIVCIGNTMISTGNHGIHAGGDGPVVIGNQTYGCRLNGYFVGHRDGTVCTRFTIADNIVRDSTGGFGVKAEFATRGTISGNVVENTFLDGIMVENNCSDISVSGNAVYGCGKIDPARPGAGLVIDGSVRISVSGNILDFNAHSGVLIRRSDAAWAAPRDVTISGANVMTRNSRYGVEALTGSDAALVTGNSLRANTLGATSMAGTVNLVANNLV